LLEIKYGEVGYWQSHFCWLCPRAGALLEVGVLYCISIFYYCIFKEFFIYSPPVYMYIFRLSTLR
jgi:hypothetical protein